MKTLVLVAVTGFVLSSALPALAASSPAKPMTGNQSLYRTACMTLEKKIDKAGSSAQMAKKVQGVAYLSKTGTTMCQKGQYANGIAILRNALASAKAGRLVTTSGNTIG